MANRIEKALSDVRENLVAMAEIAERNFDAAVMAVVERDRGLAADIERTEDEADELGIAVSAGGQEALYLAAKAGEINKKMIARVFCVLETAVIFEQMGDLMCSIARQARFLMTKIPVITEVEGFEEYIELVSEMVRDCVASLVNEDTAPAWQVCSNEEVADKLYEQVLRKLLMPAGDGRRRRTGAALHLAVVAFALERIADLASDVAQNVIYMIEGKLVKHHLREFMESRKKMKQAKRSGDRSRRKE